MAIVRPATQVSNIGWSLSGGANYATILGDNSDSTYVYASSSGSKELAVDLPSITDPGTDSGFAVGLRGRQTISFSGIEISVYQVVSSKETLIQTFVFTVGTSFSDQLQALTNASAITDFSQIRIYALETGSPSKSGDTQIADIWLVVPSAGSSGGFLVNVPVFETNVRTYDYPTSGVIGQDREMQFVFQRYEPSSGGPIMGGKPLSVEDAKAGGICEMTGNWYPGHQLRMVDGRRVGRHAQFEPEKSKNMKPKRII